MFPSPEISWASVLVSALASFFFIAPSAAQTPAPTTFTMKGFQTDLFTGAATLEVPGLFPAGTAGTAPRGSLVYNSGTADELGPRDQGQGTGLGWTLGPDGAVIRDTKGTLTTDDDTFRLVFGGANHDLVKIDAVNNIYHTADEMWVKVQYVTAGDYWLLWTKDGTKHRFGFNTDSKGIALGPDGITPVSYLYKIDEVTTTSGVSTRYAWTKVTATLSRPVTRTTRRSIPTR